MPYRFLRAVDPIVAHGLREMSAEGMTPEHTLREVAIMGALVGTGVPANQAVRMVEAIEPQLLGMPTGEAAEPYHGQPGMGGFGKGGFGKGPWGKQMPGMMDKGMGGAGKGMMPWGKQMPGMMDKGMGGAGMGMMPWGKQMPGMMDKGMGGAGKGMMPWGQMPGMMDKGMGGAGQGTMPWGQGQTPGQTGTPPYMGEPQQQQ